MKITLDHNCIIDIYNHTEIGEKIGKIISYPSNQCFIVNIGASEMRKSKVLPDHYEKFEELLNSAGISHLPRLDPMVILDVTFWDRCIWSDDEMIELSTKIEKILFGNKQKIDISKVGIDSPLGGEWLNRLCDVHGLWCHIFYKNDVFLTLDNNFKKKLPKLIPFGVGRVCHPNELLNN